MRSLLAVVFALACFTVTAPAQEAPVAIKAGRLIDGTGASAIENAVIVVQGNRIVAVGPAASVQIPQGATIIDLGRDTVMPGMIDGHFHPTIRLDAGLPGVFAQIGQPSAVQGVRGARNLRVALLSGVTSGYVAGEVNQHDFQLKQAIDGGIIPGPRLYTSGPWVLSTFGHSPAPETNGPWPLRNMVRKQYELGAHHIKLKVSQLMLTGPNIGAMSKAVNFTPEELAAVVDEAHRSGMKITCHAMHEAEIRAALEAGIDSIQHATELTPEIADLFVKHRKGFINTDLPGYMNYFTSKEYRYLDTQANSSQDWIAYSRKILDGARNDKWWTGEPIQQFLKRRSTQIKEARKKGVPMAVGTDDMQGLLALEVEHLVVNIGLSPLEAISAATGMGAKVLGIDNEVGTLEKGKYADIISIKGMPDKDIRDLSKVNFVMVGGQNFSGLSFR
jgi:imidazolonepropionase-like amidohydrolase